MRSDLQEIVHRIKSYHTDRNNPDFGEYVHAQNRAYIKEAIMTAWFFKPAIWLSGAILTAYIVKWIG